jgi:hypothetical protein
MSKIHNVKQGETMILISHLNGFLSWETIWDHDRNKALREKRPNPQTLYPGDIVFIPDKEAKEVDAEVNTKHTFKLRPPKNVVFKVWLRDETEEPFANCRYELKIDGETIKGITTADGLVLKEVKPTARHASLKLWIDDSDPNDVAGWEMDIGHLDPADTVSGAQARLQNLGYKPGKVTGTMNNETLEAIKAFQQHIGYDIPTGELDERTNRALSEIHDERERADV